MGRPKGSKNKPKGPGVIFVKKRAIAKAPPPKPDPKPILPKTEDNPDLKYIRIGRDWGASKPSPQEIEEWISMVEARDGMTRENQIYFGKQIAGTKPYWFLIQRYSIQN